MFGFEGYGTKYYGQGDAVGTVVSDYPIHITISQSDIYEIEIAQADIYNIIISVTGGGT